MSDACIDSIDLSHVLKRVATAPIKPVKQTRFGVDGNCLSACIASILGCPIELVDISAATDTQWQRSINRKLRDLGFCLVTIPWCQSTRDVLSGIHIRHGMSERSAESTEWLTHAVIYCGNKMVHDPHPDNSGIMGWSWASVLAPLWSRP